MKSNIRVRILRKTRQGVTLKLKSADGYCTKDIPWSQFEESFNMVDGIYAVPKEGLANKVQLLNKNLNALTLAVLRSNISGRMGNIKSLMAANYTIGKMTEDINKEFDMPIPEIVSYVYNKIRSLSSINDSLKETPVEYRVRKAREKHAEEEYHRGNISNATVSMADAKGFDKLKDLLE